MTDLEKPAQQPAWMPQGQPLVDIEIVHRRSPGGGAEQISINLQAVPSFEAFGRFLDSANPFEFWAQAVQMAWLPWHAAFQAMLPPGSTLPLLGPLTPRSKASPGGMK